MVTFSALALAAVLDDLLPSQATGELCVALSGGLDSTVLLSALAEVLPQRPGWTLRAVHIDHQLHPSSVQWQQACARFAHQLGIQYEYCTVDVARDSVEGIEAAARTARYDALRRGLRPGESLLTAHHADDQLETVLLALLRGSGVKGLAAMPFCAPFGSGWHLRPLLKFVHVDLQRWAQERNLLWVDDPSNAALNFSRNYLRAEVVPQLRARWPSASITATRSAAHAGEAITLLDELAQIDHDAASIEDCLDVAKLRALSGPRRRNLLRYWVRKRELPLPSTAKLRSLDHDALMAQWDRSLCVHWAGAEVRRHRDLLYANAPLSKPVFAPVPLQWHWEHEPLALGNGMGALRAQRTRGRGLSLEHLQPTLTVRGRYDGERLHAAGRPHQRSLKHLLQESAVLPWWRSRLPLICVAQDLAAVADLYVTQRFAASPDEEAVEIVWLNRPSITAVRPAD